MAKQHNHELEQKDTLIREAEERVSEVKRGAVEREGALQMRAEAAEERSLELQQQIEWSQQQAKVHTHELEQKAMEHDAAVRKAEERINELERGASAAREHEFVAKSPCESELKQQMGESWCFRST